MSNTGAVGKARRRAASGSVAFIPHARRRETKTDAIVRAAMGVLEAEGIDGLTLQRVAHALGITTTALYRYFPSKDALLAALQRDAVTELHEALKATLAAVEPPLAAQEPRVAALARILAVARFHRELPRTHPDAHRLVAVLLGDPRNLIADEQAAATVPLLLALLGDVHALFDAAAATGACERGDAKTRAIVLWATLQGLGQLSKLARLAPRSMAPGDVERDAVAALLRGFGAEARLVDRAARALGNDERRGGRK